MDTLIDFGIYGTLMLWSFVKCALLGGLIAAPILLAWCLCVTGARADEAAQRIFEERNRR